MKRIILVVTIAFSLFSCNGQTVPGVGGMQKPVIVIGGEPCVGIQPTPYTWDFSSIAYNGNYMATGFGSAPTAIAFTDDGLTMYVAEYGTTIHQYDLTTAWDLTTASYSKSAPAGITQVYSINFINNGCLMILGRDSYIADYTLSTPYDVSTASPVQSSTFPANIDLNWDASEVIAVNASTDAMYQYSIGTAGDISTFSTTVISSYTYTSSIEGNATNVMINPDGSQVMFCGTTLDRLVLYDLSTNYDLSTATLNTNQSTRPTCYGPRSITSSTDGTYIFMGDNNRNIYRWEL